MFSQGLRFPENIGPAGSGRIMGSETALLHELFHRGCRMVYCPAASVGHRVKPEDCRIVRIRNTLHLGEIEVSAPMLEEVRAQPDRFEILEAPRAWHFDAQGNLAPLLDTIHAAA